MARPKKQMLLLDVRCAFGLKLGAILKKILRDAIDMDGWNLKLQKVSLNLNY